MSQPHSAFPYTGNGAAYTGVDRATDDEKKETPDGLARTSDGQPTACHEEFNLEKHGSGGYDRKELLEPGCYNRLGFSFPAWKKWTILSVIFAAQISMNFNAGFYASGVTLFSSHFGISEQVARVGQMDFLIAYGFRSEFWTPWSEECGRWPVMQLSLFLVNIWQIPCALAPRFGTIVVCRILGGLSSAGGSVTLGMVADMWEAEDQQYAVAFIFFASVAAQ